MAGSLGVSSLVCLLNNGKGAGTGGEQRETTHNLLGPFWRLYSPRTADFPRVVYYGNGPGSTFFQAR